MTYSVTLCIYALFLSCSISTISCLQCYVCNTINPGQEDCAEITEGDEKYLTTCTPPHNQTCRIQEQWVDFEVLSQTHEKRTVRQCASTPFEPDRVCYARTGFGGKVRVCNCVEDGCNEASKTASTILMTLALLFLIKLFS